MKRLLLCAALALTACAPVQTSQTAAFAIVALRDGGDIVVPNPGEALLDHWGLVLNVTPDYTTDAQGQAWCPIRKMLTDPKYGPILELSCDMPALAGSAQRRVVTVTGKVLGAQGAAYRASSGIRIVPIVLP